MKGQLTKQNLPVCDLGLNCAAIKSIVLDFKIFLDQKNYRAFRETGCKSVQLVDIIYRTVFTC